MPDPNRADSQPNILFIMPDQMRGDCLSLDGHPVLTTPNIDAIGVAGTYFRRGYTTCPSCIPARRALLTGQYPATNGLPGFRRSPLHPDTPLLPQCLADAGYVTAIVGRNMHQEPYEAPCGYHIRIDGSTYVDDDAYACDLEAAYPGQGGVKSHGISFNGYTARPWQFGDALHPTTWVSTRARRVIAEHDHAAAPLFLTASYYAPHPPLIPPACYLQRYLDQDLPPLAIGDHAVPPPDGGRGLPVDSARCHLTGENQRYAQAAYYALIHHIDDQINWLVSDFRGAALSHRRPWVIIFSSDHGEMLGDHYLFRKCEPFEGSARVPFLIGADPALGLQRGAVCHSPVCLEDIMPTCLEFAGAPIPPGVDGRSLLPILRGQTDRVRDWLHGEHSPCYSQEQAFHLLTDGRWKYIWRPLDGRELLFDLIADPGELRDLSTVSTAATTLAHCRARLIATLRDRPEGFVADGALVPGRDYPALLPHALKPQD